MPGLGMGRGCEARAGQLGGAWPPKGKKRSRRRPTLARAGPALPSAKRRLTSVFGMGTGMAASLWPPAKRRRLHGNVRAAYAASFRGGGLRFLDEVWKIS